MTGLAWSNRIGGECIRWERAPHAVLLLLLLRAGEGEEEEEKKTPFSHFLGHIVNTWGVMLVEHVLFGLTYASDVEECTAGIRLVPEIGRTGHRQRSRWTRIHSRGHTLPPGFFLRLVFFLKGVFVLLLHLCPSTHSLVLMMETDHPRLSRTVPPPLRLLSSPPRSPCA